MEESLPIGVQSEYQYPSDLQKKGEILEKQVKKI